MSCTGGDFINRSKYPLNGRRSFFLICMDFQSNLLLKVSDTTIELDEEYEV